MIPEITDPLISEYELSPGQRLHIASGRTLALAGGQAPFIVVHVDNRAITVWQGQCVPIYGPVFIESDSLRPVTVAVGHNFPISTAASPGLYDQNGAVMAAHTYAGSVTVGDDGDDETRGVVAMTFATALTSIDWEANRDVRGYVVTDGEFGTAFNVDAGGMAWENSPAPVHSSGYRLLDTQAQIKRTSASLASVLAYMQAEGDYRTRITKAADAGSLHLGPETILVFVAETAGVFDLSYQVIDLGARHAS